MKHVGTMKKVAHPNMRRAARGRRSIIVTLLVLIAAIAIAVLYALGLYVRACLIASMVLMLSSLCYAVWTLHSIREDNARLQREITIAKLRASAMTPPLHLPKKESGGPSQGPRP